MKVIANKENLHIVDTCMRCNKDMYEGEKYYDINGQTFCRKCFLKEKLIKLWKTYDTNQLAHIFKKYMKNIGVRKYDRRRKSNGIIIEYDKKLHCYGMSCLSENDEYSEEIGKALAYKRFMECKYKE